VRFGAVDLLVHGALVAGCLARVSARAGWADERTSGMSRNSQSCKEGIMCAQASTSREMGGSLSVAALRAGSSARER
jgi:hypothetical protein